MAGAGASWWVGLAKLACAAVALGVLTVCWAVHSNPERHAVTAFLQYVPYPVYLGPALGACFLSLWLGWRWRAVSVASVLLVLIVVMDFRMGSPDEEGSGHVRFMTYNAKTMYAGQRRNGWGELAQEVITQDPDVLVMQDANNMFNIRRERPDLFNAILGNRKAVTMGQYVVASRLPFRDCKAGWISFRKEAHTYLHCVLVAHGVEIDLVTAHFLTPRMGLNAVRHEGASGVDEWRQNMLDRLTQARTLSGHLGRLTRPRIVAGDLNAPERSSVVQMLLDTGLRDAWSSSSMGYGFTYGHSLRPHIDFLRIDHILVSDEIGVARAWVGGHEASEHSPVIADLRIHRYQP